MMNEIKNSHYRIIHIVEHYPKGTIFRLIEPLSHFKNQSIIYTVEDISGFDDLLIQFSTNDILVLHSTGRFTEIFSRCVELTQKYSVYIFLHVSPNYMRFQKRHKSLNQMIFLSEHGIKFLSPCIAIKKQLYAMGIKSDIIQIGIPEPIFKNSYDYLNRYIGKIITCCSEDTEEYLRVKGIDKFVSFCKKHNLNKSALIVGCNMQSYGIESVTLSHDEFMYVLNNACVYVQFSLFEAYNITAVEAKRLRTPVVVLNSEGVKDNVLYGYVCANEQEMSDTIIKVVHNEIDTAIIENNYRDSICRESLENFSREFYRLMKG